MSIKKTITALLLCIASLSFTQQEQDWVKGELLIQLSDNSSTEAIQKEFSNISLLNGVLLSEHMNIWRFTFDNSAITMDEAVQKMYSSQYVITAQRNHKLEQRAVPDDTDYGDQWQYSQPSDKDIDADEAWDVTTGGLTSTGDTIVVCVIDDGVNLSHPDLIPNLWRNYNEIPGNGVDDDGNGYVDDVRGWNAYTNNDNVAHEVDFGEGHGSAVAGVVGAKGNNGSGVAGVNWNVKVMVVKGGGAESEAIAAYSYALENRKLYNSTDGAKGAFIVATNASWGVDGGTAESAPLWCAMYDTLGNHGVLSAGATVNGNVNVDVDGDLPTQCASPFLISVTNTTITDAKETEAGYGSTSIDLGAPGSGVWTVDQFSNGYAAFGGTSGATPHVAGTIGLLYSVPCLAFANLAKSDPKLAAEKVRDYILTGVDANASLADITTTGGRLNVNNAVQNMVDNCAALSIEEEKVPFTNVTLYPNPVTGNTLTLVYNSSVNEQGNIFITDMTGKIIYTQELLINSGVNKIAIDLPVLAEGMYNLSVISNTGNVKLKFFK